MNISFSKIMTYLLFILFLFIFSCDDYGSIISNSQYSPQINYYDLYLDGVPIPDEFIFNTNHIDDIEIINFNYEDTKDDIFSYQYSSSINDAYLFFENSSVS